MKKKQVECIIDFKDPDVISEMCEELGISGRKHFEFGDYGKVKLTVNAKLEIVSAEFVKLKDW